MGSERLRPRTPTKRASGITGSAGVFLVAVGFSLTLHSVPSETPPLPSFPFFSPPLDYVMILLLVTGAILTSWGWLYYSDGSLASLIVVAAASVVLGVVLQGLSFVYAVPITIGDQVFYVAPYSPHSLLVVALGLMLGFFTMLFGALRRLELRRFSSSDFLRR